MNKHFEDARYYLKRAGETAKKGVEEELDPVRERFQNLTGESAEPEPGRLEKLRSDLETVQADAEGEAKDAIGKARAKLSTYREEQAE